MTDIGKCRILTSTRIGEMPGGWKCKETYVSKPYKTFKDFLKAAEKAFEKVEYDYLEDALSAKPWRLETGDFYYTIPPGAERRLVAEGVTVGDILKEFGEISYAERDEHYKRGYDLKFHDGCGVIYVYTCER